MTPVEDARRAAFEWVRWVSLGMVCLAWAGVGFGCKPPGGAASAGDEFARLMNVGKNYYEKGEAQRAIEPFQKAVALNPTSADAFLNLANASLLANQAEAAVKAAQEALKLDPNLAAARYVMGCAFMRLRQFEPALKELQAAREMDPTVGAVTFQLGRAHQELGHWPDAVALFQELLQFEPGHPVADYTLSQALIRANLQAEAAEALERHRKKVEKQPGTMDAAKLERCVHTHIRAPFIMEQPDARGIGVKFADATAAMLPEAAKYQGPLGVLDYNRDGRNSLLALEGAQGFRLLVNSNGTFRSQGQPWAASATNRYRRALVADLQNDRFEDVMVLGTPGSRAFKLATNAQVTDASAFSKMRDLGADDGLLADLDFTGKLDLVAVLAEGKGLKVLRNLGNLYFKDITATSGVPSTLTGVTQVAADDWNSDDLLDLVVARRGAPPMLLLKQRGGPLAVTNTPAEWPAGEVIALGDFNNDLRPDLAIATGDRVAIVLNGVPNPGALNAPGTGVRELVLVDYDNDGWLDLLAVGKGLRAWRNLGAGGFRETTKELGFDLFGSELIDSLVAADFDNDGDTDLALSEAGKGVRLARNDGGNANLQLKVRLLGNKSNASGLGTRVEVTTGGLRLGRRVMSLPVEIGVGQHHQLESLNARWLNLNLNNVDVKVDPKTTLDLLELTLPDGSCPYLYAWDGTRFRFVTDLLGAAPAGLRVSDTRFVEADPEEYVWLGNESMFQARDGHYLVEITEELREVLYLDAAQLVVADHPPGTEVHTTGKMVPSRPFPPHDLVSLRAPRAPLRAVRNDGLEVTGALQRVDGEMAAPVQLRAPQLRGLAEPWSVTLEFGELATDRSLVLALTGWIRFGGGMANVAASQHPELPFPFPTLEAETTSGAWRPVDVVVGTPAGKTKTILVELTGRLPAGCRRLRLSTAFEMYWDRAVLLERETGSAPKMTRLNPEVADLHWHGFGEFEDWPAYLPLTPKYERVSHNPKWRITPAGWCTRYGDVRALLERRDDALVLLNGGDAVTLAFAADRLPPKPEGMVRDFFLYTSGWDKDSDFHCERGWEVDPIPWHGMDDQQYGRVPRPVIDGDGWMAKYNTRWVGPWTLRRPESTARLAAAGLAP